MPGPSTPLLLDHLYVGSWTGALGQLYQLRLSDGFIEKQVTVGNGSSIVGDVSSEDGTQLFVGTAGGKIYKYSPLPLP